MVDYTVINLDEIISLDKEIVFNAFKSYEPKYNETEVYDYLNNYAIKNNELGYSKTYLIINPKSKELIIYGYFTICNKIIELKNISKTKRKKLLGYNYPNNRKKDYFPAYLIGQISVNNKYPNVLEKYEVMNCCLDTIKHIRSMIGCNIIILECKNNDRIINYYKENGFSIYNKVASNEDLITMVHRLK